MTVPAARRPIRRPAPPAPSLGTHESVDRYGRHLGAVVDVMGAWVPVCVHRECRRRLLACASSADAKKALRLHWTLDHAVGVK